jgi:hypothetical protein
MRCRIISGAVILYKVPEHNKIYYAKMGKGRRNKRVS